MTFIIKDRVKEGTTTAGTGAFTLGGSSATFEPFNSYMVDGDTSYYAVVHTTSGVDEWEVGLGTWNTGNTLTRTTVLSGSNGTSVVDFSAGTKDIFMTYPAAAAATLDVDSQDLSALVALGNHDTGDLAEGSNLYYTDSRVNALLSGGTGVTYNSGAISIGQAVGTGDTVTFGNVNVTTALDVGGSVEVETHIDLKTTTGNKPSHAEGRIFYDAAFGALAVYNDEADITLQVGQEEYIRVKNNTGSTVTNGTPVYLTGEDVSTPTISVARADGTYNQSQAVGIATHDITTNSVGYVTVRGLIGDVDTSHLTVGEKVHVAIGASGGTQTASPTYPNYPTEVGICLISAASGGCIYVYTQTEALESLRVTGNSHFDANVTIDGDLTIIGNQTIASTSNVSIANAWNYFNSGDTIGALNTAFTGTGLDDGTLTGHFTGTSTTNYYIRIDSVGGGTGGVDTFEWSTDNFATFVAQDVDITATDQLIHSTDNIAIKFNATTGHTLGDVWTGTGSPINVDTGFASNRNTGTSGIGYTHMGIFYDVSTNKWTVFDEYSPEPEGTIDVGHSSFSYGTIKAGNFEGVLTGSVTGDVTGNVSGSATSAIALATARTIGGVSFDGSANINLAGVNIAGNQDTSGTASTATALETARTIGGVSFDGTANINLAGVNTAGNQDTSGNSATATALATARTIALSGGVVGNASFDGTGNISITASVQDDSHAHVISNVDGLQTELNAKVDDSTVITAGSGLTGGGALDANRTIAHADTSTQASLVALSGASVVSDVDLDTYGHVTNLTTRNLTLGDLGYTGATDATNDTVANAALPKAGGAVTGDVTFGDNNKAIFGAGSDLQIYHDGNNRLVTSGDLLVNIPDGDEFQVLGSQTASLRATATGSVRLFYNGLDKLATTSTGIDVTGEITTDGMTTSAVIKAPDGSAAAPAYTNSGDTDGGMYFPAANQVALAAGGAERLLVNSTGVDITGTVNADAFTGASGTFSGTANEKIVLSGSADPFIRFQEFTTDKAYIQWNSAGFLDFRNQENGKFKFQSTVDGNDSQLILIRNDAATVTGDDLGSINFGHTDGTPDFPTQTTAQLPARIVAEATETTGSGDDGARLRFFTKSTNVNKAVDSIESMRLEHNGDAVFYHELSVPNTIVHSGDTDTYIQFHAADQFRVVTGGSERLEVNNTRTQIDTLLVTGTATFDGAVVGAGASTTAGDVGTYMWARRAGSTTAKAAFDFGSTYAGSDLYPAGFAATVSSSSSGSWYYSSSAHLGISPTTTPARSGTWRCMGQTTQPSFDENHVTLFVRIS